MKSYLDRIGYPMPLQMNPAEFVLDLVNTDFASDNEAAQTRLLDIQQRWVDSAENSLAEEEIKATTSAMEKKNLRLEEPKKVSPFSMVLTLLHRAFIKSYRDVVAYGVRIAMYLGKCYLLFSSCEQPRLTDIARIVHHDGNRMVAFRGPAGRYPAVNQCFGKRSVSFERHQGSNTVDSSLARHSCPSWRWRTFPRFSKTVPFSSRNEQTASTARPHLSYLTSSLAFHIYVRSCPYATISARTNVTPFSLDYHPLLRRSLLAR